jgi:hypothetical protein
MKAIQIVRTATLVATLAICATSAACFALGSVPAIFAPTLRTLHKATFPVLLPTEFDGTTYKRGDAFTLATADAHHYNVQVNLSPDCNGANVCSAGSFGAFDATYRRTHRSDDDNVATTPRKPDADDREAIKNGREILDRPTRLKGGAIGYYSEYISGASDGGNSTLRWTQGGVVYVVTTRISTQKSLVATANSAIANGALW